MKHDPAREALAAAIATASTAHSAATRAREVFSRAGGFLRQAQVRRVEAEEALDKALAEHSENLVSAIASGASPSADGMLRAARARLVDAEDEVAGAQAAFAKLEDAVNGPEADAAEARRGVEKAIAGVVAGHVMTLLEEAQRLQFEYLECCAVLNEAQKLLFHWNAEYKAAANFLGRASSAVNLHLFGGGVSAAAVEWRQAVEALSSDPTARLPSLRGR